jgi:hypothetical protein
MTENLRIAILKLYTTQEIKDLLLSQCDLIDEELALKNREILNLEKEIEVLKNGEYYTHDVKVEYTDQQRHELHQQAKEVK